MLFPLQNLTKFTVRGNLANIHTTRGRKNTLILHERCPTKRTRGIPILQPPVQAASVEEMPAGDPVHHRVGLEPGQADRAFVFVLGRGTEEGSERGRGDPTPKLLTEGREFGRIRLGFIEIGRLREVDADKVKDRPYDLLEDGDRDRRVYEDDCEDAFGRGGEAREPHLE